MLSLEPLCLQEWLRAASLAALLLFLRRPAPTGTLRSVPPAVQYRWQPCRKLFVCQTEGVGVGLHNLAAQEPCSKAEHDDEASLRLAHGSVAAFGPISASDLSVLWGTTSAGKSVQAGIYALCYVQWRCVGHRWYQEVSRSAMGQTYGSLHPIKLLQGGQRPTLQK